MWRKVPATTYKEGGGRGVKKREANNKLVRAITMLVKRLKNGVIEDMSPPQPNYDLRELVYQPSLLYKQVS